MAISSVPVESKGERIYDWKSQSSCWPAELGEILDFGLVHPRTKRWIVRISVRWVTEDGMTKAIVNVPLADWIQSPEFLDVAAKLEGLLKSPTDLPAIRLALVLASCGFRDTTRWNSSITDTELRREIRETEEHLERLQDRLATGYYAH